MYGFGGLGHTWTGLSFRLVEPPMFTCCTGYYLVVLSEYGSVLVGTWWYWVNITWYCLVLSGTWLVSK